MTKEELCRTAVTKEELYDTLEYIFADASNAIHARMASTVGAYEELHLREAKLLIEQAWIQIEYAMLAGKDGR